MFVPVRTGALQIRFHNNGGRAYLRCEAHLTYDTGLDATRVTMAWTDDGGPHQESHCFEKGQQEPRPSVPWKLATGRGVQTRWVEFTPQ